MQQEIREGEKLGIATFIKADLVLVHCGPAS